MEEKLKQAKETYERDGIAIIPSVFTREECDEIRKAAYSAVEVRKNPKYRHEFLQMSKNHPALIFWPSLMSETLEKYRKDERLAEIVRYFLGNNVKQLNNQVYFRESGDGDEFAWHQDVCFRNPRTRYPGIETSYLQTIIAVDDIGLENSPVEFIPGSHTTGEHKIYGSADMTKMLRTFKRQGLKGKKYTANAGDVMIWSVMTVHGSEANESKGNRMTYMNGFAKADSALDWGYYLKDGEVVDYEHKLIP